MKYTLTILAFGCALLSACGGGGSSANLAPAQEPVVTTPVVTSVTNPLTGAAASGTATRTIAGMAIPNAQVSAYSINADGSSGASLGAPVTVAASGEFSISLTNSAPNWVRLVSSGGQILRQSDNSYQTVSTLELVAPYVTTSFNYLKISPVTDIASHVFAYKAKTGATLSDAFKFSMSRVLLLDTTNLVFQDDTSVYLNMLKGSVVSDKGFNAMQSADMSELLRGIERFGIMYDLPQREVWRALAATAENSYANALDGAGAPISMGTWTNGAYVANSSTLAALLDAKTLAEIKVLDSTGKRIAPKISDIISRYLIEDIAIYDACDSGDSTSVKRRYPFLAYAANGSVPAATCTEVRRRVTDFSIRMANNNSRVIKQ